MTMHLVRGMTSLNTRKRSVKIDMVSMEAEFKAFNKEQRRRNMPELQFKSIDAFIDYRLGRGKKITSSSTKSYSSPKPFVRETVSIPPSRGADTGVAARKESPKYSGDYLIGIATMHKSNLVAVGREDSPVNYSTMRRS